MQVSRQPPQEAPGGQAPRHLGQWPRGQWGALTFVPCHWRLWPWHDLQWKRNPLARPLGPWATQPGELLGAPHTGAEPLEHRVAWGLGSEFTRVDLRKGGSPQTCGKSSCLQFSTIPKARRHFHCAEPACAEWVRSDAALQACWAAPAPPSFSPLPSVPHSGEGLPVLLDVNSNLLWFQMNSMSENKSAKKTCWEVSVLGGSTEEISAKYNLAKTPWWHTLNILGSSHQWYFHKY